MEKRRSVRSFSSKAIDPKTIEELIQVAVMAPSVENTQPWRFHVVTDEKLKAELAKISCYGNFVPDASAFIVVTCDRSAHGTMDQGPIWNLKEMEYSCAGAMYGLMLAAEAKGIASCWVSLHHGPAHNALKLKDHQVVIGGMMLGYVGQAADATPQHQKAIKDVVVWHQ